MAHITENLQTIYDCRVDIKQAIIDKGGNVGDLTTYANAIRNLPTGDSNGGSGGGSSSGKGDVTFYDYDGIILHSYSKDDFLALTALPDLPTQPGLTCQGWNYDITNAKSYVEKYGKLDIGATYITDDGKTRLYIRIASEGRMDIQLYYSQTKGSGVVIDWGDGISVRTLDSTGNKTIGHTYTNIGDYCITFAVDSDCTLGLGNNSSSYCVMGSLNNNNNKVYCNMLQKVEIGTRTSVGAYAFCNCYSLSSVIIPNSVTSIGAYAFRSCYSLSAIVIPKSVYSIGTYAFHECYSLSSILIPYNSVTSIGTYAFCHCRSLSSIVIPNSVTSINEAVFSYCYSLSSVIIPNSVTSIGAYAFQYCYGMAFYDFSIHTPVPTLSNTNAFSSIPSDCKIIVSNSLYDVWKIATNWSTYASNIIKKSDWDALQN